MSYLLDTCAASELIAKRPNPGFAVWFQNQHESTLYMSVITIGEYVAKLANAAPELVNERAEIPWTSIIGMRNRIAHGYYGLDFELVWDTVQRSIPELLAVLSKE